MRALLIRPPVYSRSLNYPGGPRFGVPLSLLYLAAVLRKNGTDVIIYDALIDFSFEQLKRNTDGIYHIGAKWNKIAERAASEKPDTVGITNPFSDFASYTLKSAEAVKAVLPGVPVVVGGPHASIAPEYFLKNSCIDYTVVREGEISFPRLISALEKGTDISGISGISYKKNKKIVNNPPGDFIETLDSLPLPAYDLVDMEKYFDIVRKGFPSRYTFEYPSSEREISLITSRGCPFNCVFCGNHLHMGRKWRSNSAEYVIRHMEHLIKNYNVRHFHIEDDNLSLDRKRFTDILDRLIEKKWDITWDTPNGIRADRLSPGMFDKIKRTGCTYLIFGIESGSQKVLDNVVRKNLDLSAVVNNIKLAKKHRIDTHAFYIIGFPGETLNDIKRTVRFALSMLFKYGVVPHLSLARPLPGTRLFGICEDGNLLTEPIEPSIGSKIRSEVFPRQMIKTEHFSPSDLEKRANSFNRKVIFIFIFKTLFWLAMHPFALAVVLVKFSRDIKKGAFTAVKQLFFGGLFYKYNYLDKRICRKILRPEKDR